MALHKYKGKLYCDASDLDAHLSVATLSAHLCRARRRGYGNFQNIRNPFYNNRNSKRWVLLESIPPELRQQIEQNIKKAGVFQQASLVKLEEEKAPSKEITLRSTQITSEAVLSSQPALRSALQKHLDSHYERHLEHYFMQAQPYLPAYRYARTCAFVAFLYDQEEVIAQRSSGRTQHLHLRSLHANVLALLDSTDLVVSVPKSERYYRTWWQEISSELQAGKSLTEVVAPLRAGNQNTRKLHAEAMEHLDYLYVSGTAMPVRQIYRQLLTYAKEQGWWQT